MVSIFLDMTQILYVAKRRFSFFSPEGGEWWRSLLGTANGRLVYRCRAFLLRGAGGFGFFHFAGAAMKGTRVTWTKTCSLGAEFERSDGLAREGRDAMSPTVPRFQRYTSTVFGNFF